MVAATDESFTIWIAEGGSVALDRATLEVRIRTVAPLSDDAVLHPYLALPAAFAGRWLGRHSLHGGAFVHGGGAWALLGDKGGGKSSTLAALLHRGHVVLSDDVLVLDGLTVFAGPRAVDLRGGELGGERLGVVGARERWRLQPAAAPLAVPLNGVVHLRWGERLAVTPMVPAARLAALIAQRVFRPDGDDALSLLDLAALPTWLLERPHGVDGLEACVDQLLGVL
jgi:hypothetical protein